MDMGIVMHSDRIAAMQYPDSWMYKIIFVGSGIFLVVF